MHRDVAPISVGSLSQRDPAVLHCLVRGRYKVASEPPERLITAAGRVACLRLGANQITWPADGPVVIAPHALEITFTVGGGEGVRLTIVHLDPR